MGQQQPCNEAQLTGTLRTRPLQPQAACVKPSFSNQPGAYERQLIRCADNPLFPLQRRQVIQVEVNQAQRRDAEDATTFQERFRALVQRAINLPPQEDSEVILRLKEDLDQAYEQASGLAGDPCELKAALKKLLEIVMRAVWRGAGNDAAAQATLREEEIARATHFALLEHPLIADLIRPDSPIAPDELAATLLSESQAAVQAAVTLFDAEQLDLLCQDARSILKTLEASSVTLDLARSNLRELEQHLTRLHGTAQRN